MKTPKTNRDEVRKNSLSIPMSKEEKERVRKGAYKVGVPMSAFARIALNDYLKKEGL